MNKYINLALKLAEKNVEENTGGPFGALIIRDDKIISQGTNKVINNKDPTAHAEVMAIREACQKLGTPFLDDCEIYTSCEPCPMCYSAIRWAKIKKIYYCNTRKDAKSIGFDDDQIYCEIIEQKQNMNKIDSEISSYPFQKWKDSQEKIKY